MEAVSKVKLLQEAWVKIHGKSLVSSSPRDWQTARQVWRAWSRQSREVREIRTLFIGRCGYQEGKGVDKKEARGRVMQETGSACCNCEEGLALQWPGEMVGSALTKVGVGG